MQHQPIELSLPEVVRLVGSGRMALPQFQRNFVWDPNKVVELLDSISHGWPIGSFLLLEGPQVFETKDFKDGPSTSREKVQYYVLDGQQRLTSIFHALTDRSDVVYFVNLDADEERAEPSFTWAKRDKQVGSRSPATHTVAALLDEQQFRSLVRELPSSRAAELRRARQTKLGFLLDDRYRTSATLMKKGIELEALARIFETINRTGVKLDAFDLMVSVLYPKGFHLRDRWNQAVTENPILKHMDTGGLEILKLVALWRRDEDQNSKSPRRVAGVRQRDVLNIPGDFVIDRWDAAVSSYCRGLRVLQSQFGVTDGEAKPSDAMVLTLAYEQSRRVDEVEISRWYWQAVVDQRYAQGANTQILTDIKKWPALSSDSRNLDDLLRGSLNDPARRNRILRLGLHGFLMRRNARDPVTSEPLRGPLEEFPVHELARPVAAGAMTETLTVDNLLLNAGSSRLLRARLSEFSPTRLDEGALESQGFPPRLDDVELAVCRRARSQILVSWFRELT